MDDTVQVTDRQVHLVSRPDPERGPKPANFALRETPLPQQRPGEALLRYREDVVVGLAAAPEAFLGLFESRDFGKLLFRVSEP